MFQHCPVYPCNCLRCQTGIDMGLVRLEQAIAMSKTYPTKEGERARLCFIEDCGMILENDTRYPDVNAAALDRVRRFTGLDFS